MLLVQAIRLAAAFGTCNNSAAMRQRSEMETRCEDALYVKALRVFSMHDVPGLQQLRAWCIYSCIKYLT